VAKPDFPLNIDRRRLMTSAAAAVTVTGIVPGTILTAATEQCSDIPRKTALLQCSS
jgi:hypothetical protein